MASFWFHSIISSNWNFLSYSYPNFPPVGCWVGLGSFFYFHISVSWGYG